MQSTTLAVSSTEELRARARESLERCGVELDAGSAAGISARSPITGVELFGVPTAAAEDVQAAIAAAKSAFGSWRTVPAPARGALVKRLGALLEEHQQEIAELITIEAGKIRSEALGEVQETIDICDFAVGLSRQLEGRTMPSERPSHRLMETWHPLGVVGVISAFNFPAAVWSWNTAVALVCGDSVVWKPSPMTPLTALACSALLDRAGAECEAPRDLHRLVIADAAAGQALVDSPDVALLSATGSERMGAEIAPRVAARLGRCLLELGGNNAAVVAPSADLELAKRGIVFAAAGTAGQRCTTLRRVIAHEDVVDDLLAGLREVFARLPIGDPSAAGTLVGPLINERAYRGMLAALEEARGDGGELICGGARREAADATDAYYVEPALVRMPDQTAVVRRETFAPILYVMSYRDLQDAIALHNGVPQGLSSSIFTRDQREAERFLAA
ncbi:MAG: aldehyde dehydrogenase family protein, partial [Solirubrobacterales bacterium]|nr:aldehyde dehydrogenase family protein [Solirubrobacterales bacterium]